ncbi:MarR family winged helix-turn-helix transcriptional regulator [Novosphingobium album (ex Hu et al. 2023)]|uniref:MarR family transcriptional regulator n=1 Tax=Novosphingobium album (ex Hu et al. 2023) TaxID=2930093 RepID=A0ABT0B356_9SPHN|nr:MarR family transcriptional regulator [Novosphingobium album (ex Hu et al. 2023)]MCJ2179398.1 MarR family transcriptional regulator [Novosphingobium album (ex Hu et al. 2023)]
MPDRDSLYDALPGQILGLARSWRQLADRVLASLEISNSTGYALLHLERLGDGVRQSDLAREIGITEASLVRTLQHLERVGLVCREADPGDGRAKALRLTADGRRLARLIDTRLIELRHELLHDVSSEDLQTTLNVLERVAARIAEKCPRP